jgi:hypothetical protein
MVQSSPFHRDVPHHILDEAVRPCLRRIHHETAFICIVSGKGPCAIGLVLVFEAETWCNSNVDSEKLAFAAGPHRHILLHLCLFKALRFDHDKLFPDEMSLRISIMNVRRQNDVSQMNECHKTIRPSNISTAQLKKDIQVFNCATV